MVTSLQDNETIDGCWFYLPTLRSLVRAALGKGYRWECAWLVRGQKGKTRRTAGDRAGKVDRVRKRWLAWDLVGQTTVRTLPAISRGTGRQGGIGHKGRT